MFDLLMIKPMKTHFRPSEVYAGTFPTARAAFTAGKKRLDECSKVYYSYKVRPSPNSSLRSN